MELTRLLRILNMFMRGRFFGKRIPLAVSWALTHRCNQQCLYCGLQNMPSCELATKQIFSIIDELESLGTAWVSFTGGEPLLREDIGDIISYARAKSIIVGVNSNGNLVGKKIKEIEKVNRLQLSLDGPKEIQDKIRGKGSYESVLSAVCAAKDHKIQVILNCTITKFNIDAIRDTLDIAKRNRLKIAFQPVHNNMLGTSIPSMFMASAEKYKRCIKYLISEKRKRGNCIINSVSGLQHLSKWPFPARINCYAGILGCRIEPDGVIYSCERGSGAKTPSKSLQTDFKKQFYNLCFKNCRHCWCGAQVEYNLSLSLNLDALFNMNILDQL